MMKLSKVHHITVSGCLFENTNQNLFSVPNNSANKAAIKTEKASIQLTRGCNGEPPYALDLGGDCSGGNITSTIKGFNYGVVMIGGVSSSVWKVNLNNYRNLRANHSTSLSMNQNNFGHLPSNLIAFGGAQPDPNFPGWNTAYGAYLKFSTMYWIEENTFNYPTTNNEAGLIIKSSGGSYNQVYNNNFNQLFYGLLAYDDNRGLNEFVGLKIECNDFTTNNLGIAVMHTTNPGVNSWGISRHQGLAPSPFDQGIPIGNYFINSTTGSWQVMNFLDWVNYHYHANEDLLNTYDITEIQIPAENQCISSFSSLLFEKELMAAAHKISADSTATVLATIVDDGDTDALTTEVILADFSGAVELYYNLMALSPNLSEEVMIEAIHKEYELPASLLTLILNSNPHAAKSSRLQQELDDRSNPLDAYQREMIDVGLELVSTKEDLESRQSYHEGRYHTLLNQIIIEVLGDTTIADKIAVIENKIAGYETVDHYYLIVNLYLQDGKLTEAQTKLNQIASFFNLDPRRNAEYADYLDVYGIIFNKMATGDSILTSQEVSTLESITYRHSSLAAGLAMVTLTEYAGYEFYEILVEPSLPSGPKSNKTKIKKPIHKVCTVYPNPTVGILLIETPTHSKDITMQITDMSGKVLLTEANINGNNGLVSLNLRHMASGQYTLQIKSADGTLAETHHIQLTK